MDGIHDLGGMQGFGPVVVERDEPVFHAPWEGRVFALPGFLIARGLVTVDAFRHAIERLPPAVYLTARYYGRWLAALEQLVVETGIAGDGPLPAGVPAPGAQREVAAAPRFAVGDAVVVRDVHPTGHTRLPGYGRGRRGVVVRVHPAFPLPDAAAHGGERGEEPTYAIRFEARELWGEAAGMHEVVHVDLWQSWLEAP